MPPRQTPEWGKAVRLGFHMLGSTDVFHGEFAVRTDLVHRIVLVEKPKVDKRGKASGFMNLATLRSTRSGILVSVSKLVKRSGFTSSGEVAGAIFEYAVSHYGRSVVFEATIKWNASRSYWDSILWTIPIANDNEHFLVIEPKKGGWSVREERG